jgi:diguanylate cyclase (GGDEF)-like protein
MFRFIPLLAGLIHVTGALITPTTSDSWDLFIYNLILLATSIWLLIKKELVMATAIGAWASGSIYSAIGELSTIATGKLMSGLGFSVFYPFIFYYILKSQQLRKISRTQVVDSLIITVGLSSLLSALVLSATSNAQSTSEAFLLTLYPIGDLLLIYLLILIGIRSGISNEYLLLFSAIIIFTLSDLGYLWLYSKDSYFVGGIVDEGWLIALMLFASCPRLPQSQRKRLNTYPPIFLALALSLSMLGWFAINPSEGSTPVLIPAVGTLLLAFIRMALALEEADQGRIHRKLAVTDELTGVGNRREFLARLEQMVADGSNSLLLLDLDGFKAVNDKHGHAAGDDVLRKVAARFTAVLPSESYLARLGGDEFGVLSLAPIERSKQLALRLNRALATPFYLDEEEVTLSVSIGVAAIDGASNPLERADAQMYAAKRSQR